MQTSQLNPLFHTFAEDSCSLAKRLFRAFYLDILYCRKIKKINNLPIAKIIVSTTAIVDKYRDMDLFLL